MRSFDPMGAIRRRSAHGERGKPTIRPLRAVALFAAVLSLCVAVAACGSSDSSETANQEGDSTSVSGEADVSAAEGVLAEYSEEPTPFPVDEPLAEKPPADTTFAYLQCATPICGVFSEQLEGATQAMGVQLSIVKSGESVSELQGAMDSIVAQKPDAVIVPSVEENIASQLQELEEMGTPVVANGVMYPEKYGIDVSFTDATTMQTAGQVLAAWAVSTADEEANVVYYKVPELSFTAVEEAAFNEAMAEFCPSCQVRKKDVSIAAIGSDAPSQVVSDLQANAETNIAVFSTLEAATGLSAALGTAGLASEVKVAGLGATAGNLQEIESGGLTGSMFGDFGVQIWGLVDAAARLVTDQPLTEGERGGTVAMQFLEADDLEGDLSKGLALYPDFEERYERLWDGE